MAKPPDAFLSYTRFDDERERGKITRFRQELADEVRAVTGEPFEIFQDIDGIGLGEPWAERLAETLAEVRFFIPILTPNYFRSEACRNELKKFLHAEAVRERNDLVLPIYYIETEVLEDVELRATDPLASTLHTRQRQDWRELRFKSFGAGHVRRALEQLARDIVKARRRSMRRARQEEQRHTEEDARRKQEEEARRQAAAEAERSAEEQTRKQAEQDERRKAEDESRRRAEAAEVQRLAEERARKEAEQEARRKAEEEARRRAAAAEAERLAEEKARRQAGTGAHGRTRQPSARSDLTKIGTVFRDADAPWCPELVVVSPGEYTMGSTADERHWRKPGDPGPGGPGLFSLLIGMIMSGQEEEPQHRVGIGYRLAVGRNAVTFEEYDHFCESTGRKARRIRGGVAIVGR
jgi:hypothetical protein